MFADYLPDLIEDFDLRIQSQARLCMAFSRHKNAIDVTLNSCLTLTQLRTTFVSS